MHYVKSLGRFFEKFRGLSINQHLSFVQAEKHTFLIVQIEKCLLLMN